MLRLIAAYPVRMTTLSWALVYSLGYLVGKTLGVIIGKNILHISAANLYQVEYTGIGVGLAFSSMVSGILTTFILQSKLRVRKAHYLIGAAGWLVAMLIAIFIMVIMSQLFAD